MGKKIKSPQQKGYVENKELILYLAAIFFYTMMTGIIGSYRQDYLVNVIQLTNDQTSFYNSFLKVAGFLLSFFYAMIIDNHRITKKGKFVPIMNKIAVPMGIVTLLMFITPHSLTGIPLMVYLIGVGLLHGACCSFGNAINLVSFVMSPDSKERDKVISFKSISSAVGNSAPLVVTLVIGIFVKNKEILFISSTALISVVGTVITLIGMRYVRERIEYNQEKKNPLEGIKDVIKNKYSWTIIVSETLKSFREIATYMGVFLAGALLGSTSKFLLFGLPTGIGTAVGMLLINFLLKKFDSRVLYIASGIYSVIANTAAFAVGYAYFKTDSGFLQILFIVFLFLIGLQFGASNLLPSMFQADVLESIEHKTGKRLDATLPFVIGIGTMISGTIASWLAPQILYGDNSIIGYIEGAEELGIEQSIDTKILLLFFYTIVHGIMMFLAGVPFFFYKLTGKTKEDIHNAVIAQREQIK